MQFIPKFKRGAFVEFNLKLPLLKNNYILRLSRNYLKKKQIKAAS